MGDTISIHLCIDTFDTKYRYFVSIFLYRWFRYLYVSIPSLPISGFDTNHFQKISFQKQVLLTGFSFVFRHMTATYYRTVCRTGLRANLYLDRKALANQKLALVVSLQGSKFDSKLIDANSNWLLLFYQSVNSP